MIGQRDFGLSDLVEKWIGEGPRIRAGRRQPRRRPGLEILESRRLLATILDFPAPTPSSAPYEIASGPNGTIWFTEGNAGKVGSLNPATDAISEITVDTTGDSKSVFGITTGPDGNIWFTDIGTNSIGMISPGTDAVKEFALPTSEALPLEIVSGPDGNLWFTEQEGDKIGEINPTAHAISEYTIPTLGSLPSSITVGPNGSLWFTEIGVNAIGSFNPSTHAFSQYIIPVASTLPYYITAGSDGNLWFTTEHFNHLESYDPTTGTFATYSIPTANASPIDIAPGPNGNLFFTEYNADQLGVINLTTHDISELPLPTADAEPWGITADSNSNVWFTEFGASKAGVDIGTHLIVTGQPPPSITAGSSFSVSVSDVNNTTGAVNTSFTGQAALSLTDNPGGGTLGGTLTEPFVNGVGTFSGLTLDKTGNNDALKATTAGPLAQATNSFNVLPSAVSQLAVVSQPPATVSAGGAFGLAAAAEDKYGNIVTSQSGSATLTLATNPGSATLAGTLTEPFVSGVATYAGLTIDSAANGYKIQATATGLPAQTTSSINVVPAVATKLVITSQPPFTVALGSTFGVIAEVEDQFGDRLTTYAGAVTIALGVNSGGSSLGGSTTVNLSPTGSSPGYATFTGLSLNKPGDGYTLVVSANGLASATTTSLTVPAPPPPPPPPPAPTIAGVSVVTFQKVNKKGKKTGKPMITGYRVSFGAAMNQGSLATPANYAVDTIATTKRAKKKPSHTVLTPVGFSVTDVSSNTVTLSPAGNPFFKKAGLITLEAASPGIQSSAGAFLAADVVFDVAKGGKSISVN